MADGQKLASKNQLSTLNLLVASMQQLERVDLVDSSFNPVGLENLQNYDELSELE